MSGAHSGNNNIVLRDNRFTLPIHYNIIIIRLGGNRRRRFRGFTRAVYITARANGVETLLSLSNLTAN